MFNTVHNTLESMQVAQYETFESKKQVIFHQQCKNRTCCSHNTEKIKLSISAVYRAAGMWRTGEHLRASKRYNTKHENASIS
jgi:aspartate carbamoyltransferase regulatory subunit